MAYHPFRHLGLKVLAIILASVLWFTVAGEHVVERSLRVPLAARNLPTSLEIVGDLPETVDVRVRGSSAQLSRLDTGDSIHSEYAAHTDGAFECRNLRQLEKFVENLA